MSNEFYNPTGWPGTGVAGASAPGRAELVAIGAGFDKMTPLSGHALEFVRINAGATAQESISPTAVRTAISAQPLDAELTAIAGLTSAADLGIQFTGVGTAATYSLTPAGKALLDDASATVQRATLGSTATGDALFITASAATARTTLGSTVVGDAVFIAASTAAARTAIGAVIGTNVQAWDADLDAVAALGATAGMVSRTGAGAFAVRTLTGTAAEITVTNGDGAAATPTFSLPAALTFTGKTVTGGTFASPTVTGGTFSSPALTTPTLGVPVSGTLTNCTGYPGTSLTVVDAAGDLLVGTAADTVARLAIGTARQVLQVNAGATAPAWAAPITLVTEQASTSGTSIDFTGIPAGVKRITIMFKGVSTNGTSNKLVQIGKSGGVETSGYLGSSGTTNFTTGFGLESPSAANTLHGQIILSLENAAAFSWVATGILGLSDAGAIVTTGGSKSLSAELDRVRITTINGTDAFDAGAINISYE